MVLVLKKIVIVVVMLAVNLTLTAQQKPANQGEATGAGTGPAHL
jgi:hypothetical protein